MAPRQGWSQRRRKEMLLVLVVLASWCCSVVVARSSSSASAAFVSPQRTTTVPFGRVRQQKQQQQQQNQRPFRLEAVATATAGVPPGCSVEVVDPETGCQVVLLGCFHGSQSSARDVEQALLGPEDSKDEDNTAIVTTDVVALELCASRFADLRRDLSASYHDETLTSNSPPKQTAGAPSSTTSSNSSKSSSRPWIARFASMVQTTWQKSGSVSTATAAAVLGSVSGLQTALSGLQPGLEFTTALQIAAQRQHDIVLADQAVDETLNRLGRLPQTSWSMWKEFVSGSGSSSKGSSVATTTTSWHESFGKEAAALRIALLGSNDSSDLVNQRVTLPAFLTRNRAAVHDLVRLLLPPILLLPALNLAAGQLEGLLLSLWQSGGGETAAATVTTTAAASTPPPSALVLAADDVSVMAAVLAANAAFLLFNYLTLALPATRIILSERDDQLTKGIQAACQLASQKAIAEGHGRAGRVVAVLGFLHVNGVAQRLVTAPVSQSNGTDMNVAARQ